jgi:PIN domain nuclease of toxin-antitoxin system
MNYLIDTHTFLWFVLDSTELSLSAKALLEDDEAQLPISVSSLWEIAIKLSLGKLFISQPTEVFFNSQVVINRITVLNISVSHVAAVSVMPFYHRDPFDRLIIAQAIVDQIPIISRDAAFDAYPITRLW